ncbi:DUF1611 domain-containing protein [candidate division KSB1 bacterium]
MKKKRRMLVLVEGMLSSTYGKTAHGAIRYIPEQVVAVIDSTVKGKTCEEVIGYGGDIPVVSSFKEGLKFKPDAFVIGIALVGGVLPKKFKKVILEAIKNKLDIINGLHTFLTEDKELMRHAKKHKVEVIDLRKPPEIYHVASGKWEKIKSKVILTIGTDCAIGKKSTTIEIYRVLRRMGKKADFIATGQTGLLISGRGVAVDAVKSDFVAGLTELEVAKSAKRHDYILVEGQGALTHQGYSGVTMGLVHGAMPDAMILCHEMGKTTDHVGNPILDFKFIIKLHEMMVNFFKNSRVVGMNLITNRIPEREALKEMRRLERKLRIPVDDAVRFGGEKLTNAILKYFDEA